MPVFHASSIRGKSVGNRRMTGGGGSFLLGNTLGGLQEAEGVESVLSGQGMGCGLGMGMSRTYGNGLSSINKKLESLMIKQSKPKPKNIKFNM